MVTHFAAHVVGAVVVLAARVPSPPTVIIDVVKQFGDGPHSVSFDGVHAAMAKASDVLQQLRHRFGTSWALPTDFSAPCPPMHAPCWVYCLVAAGTWC